MRPLAYALVLALSLPAAAEDVAVPKGVPMGGDPVGPSSPAEKARNEAWSKAVLDDAAKTLMEGEKARCIVAWINANGCMPDKAGKPAPVNTAQWDILVKHTRGKSEVLFGAGRRNMQKITGMGGDPQGPVVPAVAVAAELKPMIEQNHALKIGTAGKNTIVFLGNLPEDAPSGSAPVGIRGPHEFLHLILRQLDNPALGGGYRKKFACKDIANRHHQLTGAIGLAESNQSSLPPFACPAGDPPPSACAVPDLTEDDKACGIETPAKK
jgi:hypothetical protein